MKHVLTFVLVLLVAFVASQPASTNPSGNAYFYPSNYLPLNTTVNGTLFSTIGNNYADFYRVWVPSYVRSVRYVIANIETAASDDLNYLEVYVSFAESGYDPSFGYSCAGITGTHYNSRCSNYDQYSDTYTGNTQQITYTAGSDFAPGRWQYISLDRTEDTTNNTFYSLTVEAVDVCSNTSIVVVDASTTGCAELSTVTNITSNGQKITNQTLIATSEYDIYLVQVPQNVTRVYAWVAANVGSLYLMTASNYAPISYYYSTSYTNSGYFNSTTNKYNFFLEYTRPNNNQPIYFVVAPYSSYYSPVNYTIQFFWNQCDASHAGYGYLNVDNYAGVAYFTNEPDCQYSVMNNNLLPAPTTTFTVAPYNSTSDWYNGYHATYATLYVPPASVGAINFTCNATTNGVIIAFSLNQMTTCNGPLFYLSCSGPTQSSSKVAFLSQDLYPGGLWSVAACNANSTASTTVSLVSNGSITAPSSSPNPISPSATPSSFATPSASPSSQADESSSTSVIPALLCTILAVAIAC